jgi:hypothetical protein
MAKGSLLMLEEQMPEPFAPLRPDSAVLASLERLKASLDRAVIQADGFTVKASVRVKTPPDVVKTVLAETAAGVQLIANRNAAEHNLEQLAVAVLEYTEDHKDRMPPSILRSRAGKPLHSWRVLILPYIGHKGLHDRLKLDEPWDSAHNKPLLARMPKVFELPGVKAQEGMTFFQVFEGAYANSDRHRAFAVNGSSNTLLIAEAANAVHWAEPIDIPYSDHVSPVTQLGSHLGPFSLCAFGDTQVRRFANVSEANLRQLIKPVYKRGFRD